jgi:hypothetical protein
VAGRCPEVLARFSPAVIHLATASMSAPARAASDARPTRVSVLFGRLQASALSPTESVELMIAALKDT